MSMMRTLSAQHWAATIQNMLCESNKRKNITKGEKNLPQTAIAGEHFGDTTNYVFTVERSNMKSTHFHRYYTTNSNKQHNTYQNVRKYIDTIVMPSREGSAYSYFFQSVYMLARKQMQKILNSLRLPYSDSFLNEIVTKRISGAWKMLLSVPDNEYLSAYKKRAAIQKEAREKFMQHLASLNVEMYAEIRPELCEQKRFVTDLKLEEPEFVTIWKTHYPNDLYDRLFERFYLNWVEGANQNYCEPVDSSQFWDEWESLKQFSPDIREKYVPYFGKGGSFFLEKENELPFFLKLD